VASLWLIALATAVLSSEPRVGSPVMLAGDYFSGDGLGINWALSLRPDGTYSFTWDGCLGRYAERQGRFRVDGFLVVLERAESWPASPDEMELPSSLVAVRWGERLYLVPEAEGARFVADVTRGWEPRHGTHGRFLLRQSDWEKPARGVPDLPEGWRKLLLPAPVEARVTRVLARHRAEIGAGSNQKLHPGVLLSLVSKKYGSTEVRVVSVGPASSIVENDYGDPPFVSGGRVTSRAW
jgi:hypothetical protein